MVLLLACAPQFAGEQSGDPRPAEQPSRRHARLAAIRAAFLELQGEYAEGLPQLVAELVAAGEAACASGDAAQLRHFQTLAHRMHGGGGSYGFKRVSAAASVLESKLADHEASEEPFDERTRDGMLAALAEVQQVAESELQEVRRRPGPQRRRVLKRRRASRARHAGS